MSKLIIYDMESSHVAFEKCLIKLMVDPSRSCFNAFFMLPVDKKLMDQCEEYIE